MKYSELNELLRNLTEGKIIPAISVAVGHNNKIVFSGSWGYVYELKKRITGTDRFDIASMTKIFSGICFMKLVEESYIRLQDPVCEVFPELNTRKEIEKDGTVIDWCDAGKITWYQVLTHTSGMGWTRPKTRPSLPNLNKGLEDIYTLPFAYVPGKHIVYSDLPVILMGVAMERITGRKLDELVDMFVCKPLGLTCTGYRRISNHMSCQNETIPTEDDTVFRKRRIWGEVHDENAFLLDGVAAHAGIFSTAEDMCRLMMSYAGSIKKDGILKQETVKQMISEQVEEDGDRRGLIWQLSGNSEKAYTKFLSEKAYGHAGFTGCFGWNDPERDLSVVLLSNDVYNGRENRKLFDYREKIMQVIVNETL